MASHRLFPIMVIAAAVAVIQLVCTIARVDYYLTQLTMVAYYSMVVVGLCLLMGYAGQISLGHAAFFAIGGYSSAVITTQNLAPLAEHSLVRFGATLGLVLRLTDPYGREVVYLSPWIGLAVAVITAATLAWLIGIPVLKLKGHYLAMATLGFGTIIYRVIIGGRIFGEADGISSVPPFDILPGLSVEGGRPERIANFYIAWTLLLGTMALGINLIHSRVGRALRAIHGNEEAASAMGVDSARIKLQVFVLSAVMAAVGGVFLTHFNGGIGPSEAGIMKSVRYVSLVALGGMANLVGTASWSVVLNFLSLRGYFGSYDDAVFGVILVTVMLFAPDGIARSPHAQALGAWVRRMVHRGPS